jgi:hypothetical protein
MSMPRELDTTLHVRNVVIDASSVYILMASRGSSSQKRVYQYQEDTISDEWAPLNMRVMSDTGEEQPLTLRNIATSLANNTVYGQSEDGVYRYDGETDAWQKLGASLAGNFAFAVSPSYIYIAKGGRISRHPIGTDREWTQGECTQLNMRDAESNGDLEFTYWAIIAAPNGDVYVMNDSFVYRHGGGPDDQWAKVCRTLESQLYLGISSPCDIAFCDGSLHATAYSWSSDDPSPRPPSEVYRLDIGSGKWLPLGTGEKLGSSVFTFDTNTATSKDHPLPVGAKVVNMVLSDDGKHLGVVSSMESLELELEQMSHTHTGIV